MFVVLLPLIVLFGDWLFFPAFFHGPRQPLEKIEPGALAEKRHGALQIGSIGGDQVFLTLDGLPTDESYLEYLEGGPNGLVIDVDLTDPFQTQAGPLFTGTFQKLMRLAPGEAAKMDDLMQGSFPAAGDIRDLEIALPPESYKQFPVDHLYVINVSYHSAPEKKQEQVMNGLKQVLAAATSSRTRNLVVPVFAVRPGDSCCLQFDQFFSTALRPLAGPGWQTTNVYFSLFSEWSDAYLGNATTELAKAWNNQRQEMRKDSVLIHENLRLVLACCSLALLVSFIAFPMTWDRIAAVLVLFTGAGFGVMEAADKFMPGHSAEVRLSVHAAVLLIFAAAFPIFIRWDPKKLFSSVEKA